MPGIGFQKFFLSKLVIIPTWIIALIFNLFWLHSYYTSGLGYKPAQPIQFSHLTHSQTFGIKCLYCHSYAETSPVAGIPTTRTCMICHIALDTKQKEFASTYKSYEKNIPLIWNKVYRLPDYVHFDHSRHTRACIDCASCHGEVENMEQVKRVKKLNMKWCLDCHRQPDMYIVFAREISGMFTYNIDSAKYFENLKKIKKFDFEKRKHLDYIKQPVFSGVPMPKYAKLGDENCSACHY